MVMVICSISRYKQKSRIIIILDTAYCICSKISQPLADLM